MNIVEEFYDDYNEFIEARRTGNKTKFERKATIDTVNKVLESLIKVVEKNEIDKIDKSIVYNVLLMSKIYVKKIHVSTHYTNRTFAILNLKNNLEKLENLNIKQENFKSRQ